MCLPVTERVYVVYVCVSVCVCGAYNTPWNIQNSYYYYYYYFGRRADL